MSSGAAAPEAASASRLKLMCASCKRVRRAAPPWPSISLASRRPDTIFSPSGLSRPLQEITSIGIECAVCSNLDLCIECFAIGVEPPGHAATHDYRVHENLSSFALYDREWTAEDELLLLQGIDMYGMGNWRCVPRPPPPFHAGRASRRVLHRVGPPWACVTPRQPPLSLPAGISPRW
jgi:hypothetical protein